MVSLINVISSHIASNSSIKRKRDREWFGFQSRTNLLCTHKYLSFFCRSFIRMGKKLFLDTERSAIFFLLKYDFGKAKTKKKNSNEFAILAMYCLVCKFYGLRENPCCRFNTETFLMSNYVGTRSHNANMKWKRTIDSAYNNRCNFARKTSNIFQTLEQKKTSEIITMIFTMGFAL